MIKHLKNKSDGSILKVGMDGVLPYVRIYRDENSISMPDKFTHHISAGYPEPDKLFAKFCSNMQINESTSIYSLGIEITQNALVEWITNNPNVDSNFGSIDDWEIIYQ